MSFSKEDGVIPPEFEDMIKMFWVNVADQQSLQAVFLALSLFNAISCLYNTKENVCKPTGYIEIESHREKKKKRTEKSSKIFIVGSKQEDPL